MPVDRGPRDSSSDWEAASAHAKAENAEATAREAARVARDTDRRQGALEARVDAQVDDLRELRTMIGRPPHANGPNDEGEGMYAIVCEIARANRLRSRSHVAIGSGAGATVVAIIVAVLQQLNVARAAPSAASPAAAPPAAVVAPR